MSISRILTLIKKDFVIELRNKQALAGVILLSTTIIFLLSKSLVELVRLQWAVLLWIIILLVGINAIVKSFSQENKTTQLYNYCLYNPTELIIAKVIYNFGFMVLIYSIIFTIYCFFFGNQIIDVTLFLTASFFGIFGISTIFSFISAISAASEDGNTLLMSILGLPLTLPILLLLVRSTAISIGLISDTAAFEDVWWLVGLDSLFLGLVILLFDELWKS